MATPVAVDPAPAPPAVDGAAAEADFLWELRKYVLLQATLAATVTYSAGLSPPGGFWPDNVKGLLAGDPVLRVTYPRRYQAFFYCNATAFVASLVTVNLLLVRSLSHRRRWLRALQAAMVLDQFGLMAAYAAGSSRDPAMSAYVLALVALVAAYVIFFSLRPPPPAAADADAGAGAAADADAGAATPETGRKDSVDRARKHLLIFATLAATVTYSAGLSTPGGFWPGSSEDGEHLAGDPMLRLHHPDRFMVFFYSNTTAFVSSLAIIMLLMNSTLSRHGLRSSALWVCAGAAMAGLMGAFAFGSCRSVKTSIYVVSLVAAVLFYIGIQILVFLCEPVKVLIHDCQEALESYLQFRRFGEQIHQHQQQQSRVAFEHGGNGDTAAYQILRKSQKYLLLLGILSASITYQAGLSPPGGFWQDNAADGRTHNFAGDPVLHITYHRRYLVFFYCNATAFVASLVILILLSTNIFRTQRIKYYTLQAAMILDLFGLVGAYAAGSCRQVSKSVYVYASVVVVSVLVYVGIHIVLFMIKDSPACAASMEAAREKLARCVPGLSKPVYQVHAEGHEEAVVMERKLEKRRKLLLLLAILAASLTYQAGMSPPRGFWQENNSRHDVGNLVVNDNHRRRYKAFFYCKAMSFVASIVITVLLVNKRLSASGIRSHALQVCLIIGLMGAYGAGSYRKISMVDVLFLFLAVIVCIALQIASFVSGSARGPVKRLAPELGRPQVLGVEDDHGSGASSLSTPRDQLVSPLFHGACKVIDSLRSGTWMLVVFLVIWKPALRQNLMVKFKVSKISAVLGVLLVSAASMTATTTMDTPSTAMPPGTGMVCRRRDPPLVKAEDEPTRPRRNRRPNSQLIGGDWVNS